MRLGTWPTKIVHGTLAEKIYGTTKCSSATGIATSST